MTLSKMFFQTAIKKKAVSYYRHSAEDKQENSVAIQREHTEKFADEHQIEIIHEEADEGKSGLSAKRPGFDQLFTNWILNPHAPKFDYVLVYDVSRWGRFQDQDESAYYEYLCKKNDKKVIYITRGIPQEGEELSSTLLITIDRYMAGQYSKQLSDKVFDGSVKVSEQGFSAGGTAPYGMVRLLLDENKKPIEVLKHGEHKVIANQRVIFAPANNQSSDVVKKIFNLFVKHQHAPTKIANLLNKKNISAANSPSWNREKIIRILTNETYIGTRTYNKTWGRLKQKQRPNPRSEWIICLNAFEAIVDKETFDKAQERLHWSNPLRWKRRNNIGNKVQKEFREFLREFLVSELRVNEDKLWNILQKLPLIVSSVFHQESIPSWCFTIKEEMRQYKYVFGVGIDDSKENTGYKFFFIPTSVFGLGNFLTLGETHPKYSKYLTDQEILREKIQNLCKN